VVGQDNIVQRKIVRTGDRQGAYRIIESGIDPGDWVVTEGVQRAIPGAKVTPQQTKLNEAAADQDSAPPAPSEPPKPAAADPTKPAATEPAK
jgi:membrane fusion protein, multidrug efflux system